MKTFYTQDEIENAVGQVLGTTDWFPLVQDRINAFAECTEDRQWIHVDAERAKEGPFETTIAHGFLVLSLVIPMMKTFYEFPTQRMALNYGLNHVRFPSPVPVDSKIRATFSMAGTEAKSDGSIQITWAAEVERQGSEKPVCVAELLTRVHL